MDIVAWAEWGCSQGAGNQALHSLPRGQEVTGPRGMEGRERSPRGCRLGQILTPWPVHASCHCPGLVRAGQLCLKVKPSVLARLSASGGVHVISHRFERLPRTHTLPEPALSSYGSHDAQAQQALSCSVALGGRAHCSAQGSVLRALPSARPPQRLSAPCWLCPFLGTPWTSGSQDRLHTALLSSCF